MKADIPKNPIKRPFRFSERELAMLAVLEDMDPGAERHFEYPFRKEEDGDKMFNRLRVFGSWYIDFKNYHPSAKSLALTPEYAMPYIRKTGLAPGTVDATFMRLKL